MLSRSDRNKRYSIRPESCSLWLNRFRQGTLRTAAGLLLLILIVQEGIAGVPFQSVSEVQVKVAYLYNFARMVEWPAEAFAGANAPLVIGVVGNEELGMALEQSLTGKLVNGRRVIGKRLRVGQELKGCHILMVGDAEGARTKQIVSILQGTNVLTVGESPRFAHQGGVINFYLEENKVRFEISQTAAERAGIRLSSQLLRLARRV